MVNQNMFEEKFNIYKEKYNKNGTAMISFSDVNNPLSKKDMGMISLYCKNVEKEFIEVGDAGEDNHLLVGRFMTDIEKPLIVDNPFSKKLLEILSQNKIIELIKNILGIKEKIYFRRVQFNQIDKNCFVGYHLDTDSNPDYIAACVIQLADNFEGGLYRVYKKDKTYTDYKPSLGSLILSNCHYPHEVTTVTSGERKSLVFFISKEYGLNRRKR